MDRPRLVNLEEGGLPFFFLPYKAGESAGAQLVPFRAELPPDGWFLVSHGDYTSGPTAPNPYEPGVYMPLTRADVTAFQPVRVFLGHTHLPYQSERVISPGSPAAVDRQRNRAARLLAGGPGARHARSAGRSDAVPSI